MMQEVRSAASSRKKPLPSAPRPNSRIAATGPAFNHYQSAVQLLQQGKYEKALEAFNKLLPAAPPAIVERCRMYIATCQRQIDKPALKFLTPEEHYDFAVSKLNTGYYEDAKEQFQAILAGHPAADYAYYGLAVLSAITGQSQDCLDNLQRAIDLNSKNRLQARVDNDFQSMVDDPRFTELLYPEVS